MRPWGSSQLFGDCFFDIHDSEAEQIDRGLRKNIIYLQRREEKASRTDEALPKIENKAHLEEQTYLNLKTEALTRIKNLIAKSVRIARGFIQQ